MVLNVKVLSPDAKLPVRRTPGAAGYDLFTPVDIVVAPKSKVRIPIGIAVQVPRDLSGIIKSRSGHALNKDIEASNGGVIDSDYRGEVSVLLRNLNEETPAEFKAGDAIAQMLLLPVISTKVVQVDELPETERGEGGFGSTDTAKAKPRARDASPVRKPSPEKGIPRQDVPDLRTMTLGEAKVILREWGIASERDYMTFLDHSRAVEHVRQVALERAAQGSKDAKVLRIAEDAKAHPVETIRDLVKKMNE